MASPRLMITSVGTSLLTNLFPKERGMIFKAANWTEDEGDAETVERLTELIGELSLEDWSKSVEQARKSSAEVNGLSTWSEATSTPLSELHHLLVVTDTWLGEIAAAQLESWLRAEGAEVIIPVRVKSLRASTPEVFRRGLSELFRCWTLNIDPYIKSRSPITINATGGFKPVQSALQSLAALDGVELFYIFQTSSELITIPALPVTFDARGLWSRCGDELRRASLDLLRVDERARVPLEWLCPISDDDEVTLLNEWGELMWSRLKSVLYPSEIITPLPSSRVELSARAMKELSLEAERAGRFDQYNEQLDLICRCLEGDDSYRSVEPRPYRSMRGEGKYYMFDLESDRDAKRFIAMLRDDGVYYIEKLESKNKI